MLLAHPVAASKCEIESMRVFTNSFLKLQLYLQTLRLVPTSRIIGMRVPTSALLGLQLYLLKLRVALLSMAVQFFLAHLWTISLRTDPVALLHRAHKEAMPGVQPQLYLVQPQLRPRVIQKPLLKHPAVARERAAIPVIVWRSVSKRTPREMVPSLHAFVS